MFKSDTPLVLWFYERVKKLCLRVTSERASVPARQNLFTPLSAASIDVDPVQNIYEVTISIRNIARGRHENKKLVGRRGQTFNLSPRLMLLACKRQPNSNPRWWFIKDSANLPPQLISCSGHCCVPKDIKTPFGT